MKCVAIIFKTRICNQLFCKSSTYRLILAFLCVPLLVGCATIGTSSFNPSSINDVRFRDRSQSHYDDDVRVTVAVPSADETKALFGADLAFKEIHPIWLKVENHSDRVFYLLSIAVDPNYYSTI